MRILLLGATLVAAALGHSVTAEEIVLAPVSVVETKALFGSIESRFVMPARARIGGVLVSIDVAEGSEVSAGSVIGRIVDDKLALQLAAAEARITAARSELTNARTELARAEDLLARGATTTQRVDQVRTQVAVIEGSVAEAEAAREVIRQQEAEGEILAPVSGRVLTVPARLGSVMLPGEAMATIAGGGVFLRLAIPERHSSDLTPGDSVTVNDASVGRIEKIYPQIENGRVIADVSTPGLTDDFVGKRIMVRIPVGSREVLAVPDAAIQRAAGLDFVRLVAEAGEITVTVVPGDIVETPDGPRREILTGLRPGDVVVLP